MHLGSEHVSNGYANKWRPNKITAKSVLLYIYTADARKTRFWSLRASGGGKNGRRKSSQVYSERVSPSAAARRREISLISGAAVCIQDELRCFEFGESLFFVALGAVRGWCSVPFESWRIKSKWDRKSSYGHLKVILYVSRETEFLYWLIPLFGVWIGKISSYLSSETELLYESILWWRALSFNDIRLKWCHARLNFMRNWWYSFTDIPIINSIIYK